MAKRLTEQERWLRSKSEDDFQQEIVDAAMRFGWKVHQVYDSRRSPEGWPDLFLARTVPEFGHTEVLVYECKRETENPTPDQLAWLALLRLLPGVKRARVVRPRDIDSILEELR